MTAENKSVNLVSGFIALRIWNAVCIQTFFQPDEFFQSLEPAWALAFGSNSGAWLTWEWREHLRSSLHPTLFAGVYKGIDLLCEHLKLDATARTGLLLTAPKIVQGVLAGCIDLFTYRLAQKIFGEKSRQAQAVLALTVLSPWNWFCSTRTFSNCLETLLTVLALDLWPWEWFLSPSSPSEKSKTDQTKQQKPSKTNSGFPPLTLFAALAAAALGCLLRPTNIIIWALIILGLLATGSDLLRMSKLAGSAILSGTLVLALSMGVDRWFYDEWVFPPWEFVQFNVVQSLSGFYGTNRMHFYFTEALLLLLMSAAPFALVGAYNTRNAPLDAETASRIPLVERRTRATFNLTIWISIMIFSLIAHKEVRFIYPLLPMLHILAARPLVAFCEPIWRGHKKYRAVLLVLGLALNTGIGYYGSNIHQRGVMDLTHHLRQEYETSYMAGADKNMTVGFFMPCHSTPWRSHLAYSGIDAWALTCEPPLGLSQSEREAYLDEADVFYADPTLWIERNMASAPGSKKGSTGSKRPWPEHVAFFEHLEDTMKQVLEGSKYRECWRGFNTHWHDDWRRKGDVVVWCTNSAG